MSKKKNISPSFEVAMNMVELYQKLRIELQGLTREQRREVLSEVDQYVKLLESNQRLPRMLCLKYALCTSIVFDYLYKAGQLSSTKDGFDPEIRKRITDVIISLANEHDAD